MLEGCKPILLLTAPIIPNGMLYAEAIIELWNLMCGKVCDNHPEMHTQMVRCMWSSTCVFLSRQPIGHRGIFTPVSLQAITVVFITLWLRFLAPLESTQLFRDMVQHINVQFSWTLFCFKWVWLITRAKHVRKMGGWVQISTKWDKSMLCCYAI